MAEITVEKKMCAACGAEVRPGALFCYSCGGAISVSPEKPFNQNGKGAENSARKSASVNQFKEKNDDATTRLERRETPVEAKIEKSPLTPETKLKSAAAMRRKPKTFQKKEVEIVWEEPQSPSSILLILTALLLAVFAAVVVILAMTLK